MRPRRPRTLANLLRDHADDLESLTNDLPADLSPELRERLAQLAADQRLELVETILRHSLYDRVPTRFRPFLKRMRALTRPRIGILRHYAPRPFALPERYTRVGVPLRPPTISIVTPSFDQGRFIERTITSVLDQRYPLLEYIVQDGGSTDETISILRRYEPFLTDCRSEPDDGQADAINRGFVNTTGEIMAWLNADDLLLPGTLAYVATYFARNPSVDVVYGHRILIDENDLEIGRWILPPHNDEILTLADYVPQETLFWRRRIWDAVGGRIDPQFEFALDWDLLLRFRDAGATFMRLPRYLGAFRVHAAQKTTVDELLGQRECAALRARVYGRNVPLEEVGRRLRPFLMRQMLVHMRQRMFDLAAARRIVRIAPAPQHLARPKSAAAMTETYEGRSEAVTSPLVPVDAASDERNARARGAQAQAE